MARLARYSPAEELLGQFSPGLLLRPIAFPGEEERAALTLDVKEDDRAYTIQADLPGVKKEDISVEINANQVSLRAEVKQERQQKEGERILRSERIYGMMSRSFALPTEVEAQGAKAEYKDGVLTLVLPKKKDSGARRLTVS